MIYQKHNNTFYYFDSAGTYNLLYAKKFANKIYPYLNKKEKQNNGDEKNK